LRHLIIRIAAYAARDRSTCSCCFCCCLALLLLPLLTALLSVRRSRYTLLLLLLLRLWLSLLRQLLLLLSVCAAAVFQPVLLLCLHTSPCAVCAYINPAAATAAAPATLQDQRPILLQLLLRL
jgi:hypothetical protein